MNPCSPTHKWPVHFNRTKRNGGHLWLCIECGKILRGQMQDGEREALQMFVRRMRKQNQSEKIRELIGD